MGIYEESTDEKIRCDEIFMFRGEVDPAGGKDETSNLIWGRASSSTR